jgi:vancomycin resistance protein YoaR
MSSEEQKVAEKRPHTGFLVALGFAFGAYLVLVIAQPILFEGRFGIGSDIAGVSVSGKSTTEAQALLSSRWGEYLKEKITVHDQDILAASLIKNLKVEETAKEALAREESAYFGLSKYFGMTHRADLEYNDLEISKVLLSLYDSVAVVPEDAKITNLEKGIITRENNGQRLMLPESGVMVREALSGLPSAVGVRIASMSPLLTYTDAQELLVSAQSALNDPITIAGGVNETISTKTLHDWLKITPLSAKTLVENDALLPRDTEGYYFLDQNMVKKYVSEVSKKVNKVPTNTVLDKLDGKMVIAKPSVTGQALDTAKAIVDIQKSILGDHTVQLLLSETKPEISDANLAELGLTELIASGWSDASGSPVNRKHNYTVGTAKFNGVLIKPDEDVSFNKILGPVDASTGYLPELVILADKTVPEFGGGLCQVSSTAFRAALNAGLPILERHNHAYPIGYYLPYGVDATIYLPTPDLRFKNDTGKSILIQTSVVGNKLFFDFYGTKKPGKVTFSGNADATGAVEVVEKVTSSITDRDIRGPKSFTAIFYRHIYDITGKLTDNDKFTSKYDSPDKYPH